METLLPILQEHPFFADLPKEYLETITGCAKNVKYQPGEFIFRTGEKAEKFYLVRFGMVSAEIKLPNKKCVIIDTEGTGEVFGWSWLFPPYKWHFDARAMVLTRVLEMDGKCLRDKQEQDHHLGYVLMKHFGRMMQEHLEGIRAQIMDFYKNPYEEKSMSVF